MSVPNSGSEYCEKSKSPLRICIVAGSFPARSETFIRNHALGLAARGHQVAVVSRGPSEEITLRELQDLDSAGIVRIAVPSVPGLRIRNLIFYAREILKCPCRIRYLAPKAPWMRHELFEAEIYGDAIKSAQPDVIHVHYGISAAQIVRHVMNFPVVVSWHGYDANLIPKLRGATIYTDLFLSGCVHTTNSKFLRRRIETLGAEPDSVTVIPMGIDLEKFKASDNTRSRKRGLEILSVGRLHEVKGQRYLIEAVSKLVRDGVEAKLTIVGEGGLMADLTRRIKSLGVTNHVSLLGARTSTEIIELMQGADLFAMTGIATRDGPVETQGLVYAEAQAVGLPVIGSNAGGVPESLIDGETGYLCPPGDPDAIARAIRNFIEDPTKLDCFGRRGRALVEEKFSLPTMLDSFERVYSRVREDIA